MRKTQSTRLCLESLEDRRTPTVSVVGDTLTVTGDAAANTIILRDDGFGNITGSDSGAAFSVSGIRFINVNTEGGNDLVYYYLDGDLAAHQYRYLTIGLGSNFDPTSLHDEFHAQLNGHDIQAMASLVINAGGGFGNDYLTMNALGTNVGVGARLKTTYAGGFGNDIIIQNYRGDNDGSLAFRSHGDRGNDTFRLMMDVLPGSTGATATVANGGDGRDIISSFLYLPAGQTPAVGSYIDGGNDFDTVNVNNALFMAIPVTAEVINIM